LPSSLAKTQARCFVRDRTAPAQQIRRGEQLEDGKDQGWVFLAAADLGKAFGQSGKQPNLRGGLIIFVSNQPSLQFSQAFAAALTE
jgi:hypothetical protein